MKALREDEGILFARIYGFCAIEFSRSGGHPQTACPMATSINHRLSRYLPWLTVSYIPGARGRTDGILGASWGGRGLLDDPFKFGPAAGLVTEMLMAGQLSGCL
jgi:hypothetical protein